MTSPKGPGCVLKNIIQIESQLGLERSPCGKENKKGKIIK